MLVFRRKIGQRFRIGNDIIITVLDVTRGVAKIGIDAPREMRIDRDEIPPERADADRRDQEHVE